MTVTSLESPPPQWDEYVEQHSQGKIYHLNAWNDIVRDTFKHSIRYLIINKQDEIQGILPLTEFQSLLFGKFSVSLPFINYGGPLVTESSMYQDFAGYLRNYREEFDFTFVELRMDSKIDIPLAEKHHKVTFSLELPGDPTILMSSFKAKLRSQIRRPIKEGMTSKKGGLNLLDDFYFVFTRNMRDLGTPVLSKSFFQRILEVFPTNSKIVCVYSSNMQPVATSFLILYKKICEIPWASSLKEYNRYSPNMLLYWESLITAIENYCTVFDFGRSTPNTGTYKFKRQWGAVESPLFWYYVLKNSQELPEINPNNPKYELAINIWRKLPLFITNGIGPSIVRNIP
jgi:FemAB-related protein (PEP-CTERM system-associated)